MVKKTATSADGSLSELIEESRSPSPAVSSFGFALGTHIAALCQFLSRPLVLRAVALAALVATALGLLQLFRYEMISPNGSGSPALVIVRDRISGTIVLRPVDFVEQTKPVIRQGLK